MFFSILFCWGQNQTWTFSRFIEFLGVEQDLARQHLHCGPTFPGDRMLQWLNGVGRSVWPQHPSVATACHWLRWKSKIVLLSRWFCPVVKKPMQVNYVKVENVEQEQMWTIATISNLEVFLVEIGWNRWNKKLEVAWNVWFSIGAETPFFGISDRWSAISCLHGK